MTIPSERLSGDLPVVDAESVVDQLEPDATVLVSGFGRVGYPKAIPLAIADADEEFGLTVVSGGSVGDEIDEAMVEAGAIDRRYPYQSAGAVRRSVNDETVAFADRHIAALADDVQYGGFVDPDVAIVEAIAVGEDWLIPSTSIGHTPAWVESVDQIIVEVNRAQPLELTAFHDNYRPGTPPNREPVPLSAPDGRIGGPRIEFDSEALTAVVETETPDSPYEFRDPTDVDLEIASNLQSFLVEEVRESSLYDDSVRVQFGVGSLGNALMGALADADFGDRDLVYFGEVIQDGLLDLLDENQLHAASATSFALSSDGQERLFENASRYAEDVVLRPADLSNSPTLVDRFGVIAVNSALEVDLYGHVNSTHVDGSRMLNGIGGSGDFTRNSPLSVITLPSTAVDGDISRIVPMAPHVDHTEHDVDVIVTERGVADLRGTSPRERARAILESCAHPDFEPALESSLERADANGGHEPHDLETAFSWQE